MKLEKIITVASVSVRLRLLAMVRSLRAVGCQLPVWVIPFADEEEDRFALPEGCEWWPVPEVSEWVNRFGAHPLACRLACFLTGNYQYADADVIFLRNPEDVLRPLEGFVSSCGLWREPGPAVTVQSRALFRRCSTNWQKEVFNSGQFACDRALFADFDALHRAAHAPEHKETCLSPLSDQPALNLLRLVAGVPVHNVTLPPGNMESTWAGDYLETGYERLWADPERQPYLIHWAGVSTLASRPIHEIFYQHLTPSELDEWRMQVRTRAAAPQGMRPRLQRAKQRTLRAWDPFMDG